MNDPSVPPGEQYTGRSDCIDFFYPLLVDVAALLDSKLDQLVSESASDVDPDSSGVFDHMEYVTGLGFVVCQEYITAICGNEGKKGRLALPPQRGAFSLAQIVDAAANYWKHHAEWSDPPGPLAERTISVLRAIGADPLGEYPMFHVLRQLQGDFPTRFRAIAPGLASWRDRVFALRGCPPDLN